MTSRWFADSKTYLLLPILTSLNSDLNLYLYVTKVVGKSYGKIISNGDKSWSSLIIYHPMIPEIYGLPKTHKPDIPLRLIISGIESALHNITKLQAKLLSPLIGTISDGHIKNSRSLLSKLTDIDMNNKYLANLDIKSLYTNLPFDRCIECLHNPLRKSNYTLHLPISKLIKICTLCTSHRYFQYNIFYKQKFVLPMGSPLNGVLACIYLEFLESGPFKYIMPNTARYFRYIDDILLIYLQDLDLYSITNWLNNVEPSTKFTYEIESNSTLPFLDILLIRNINKLEFKVYRKPTCKNDQIHFYSHHNNTKRVIIIGFYLRALCICSSKYLNDELNHIENSFLNLLHPKSFIHFAKSKALKIHNKNQPRTNAHSQSYKTISHHRFITLPYNSSSHIMINNLNKLDIKTTSLPSKTIRELVHSSP